jgi:hypothetical protein
LLIGLMMSNFILRKTLKVGGDYTYETFQRVHKTLVTQNNNLDSSIMAAT